MSFHIFVRMTLEVRCQNLQDANIDQYTTIESELLDKLTGTSGVPDAITELAKLRHVESGQATPTELAAVNEAIVVANGILSAESLNVDFDAITTTTWVDLGDNLHYTDTGGRSTLDGSPWTVSKTLTYKDGGGASKSASFSGNVRLVLRYEKPEV